MRVRAPELRGRGWLNTGGKDLKLADFRGKILVLDFWTFCCINCLHVLDELRPLEQKYGDVLTIVGIHSPKFEHEKDPDALAAAVERYGVEHPVLDDPQMDMWQQYAAKAWPTLSVVDPEGYVVASMAGEGHAEGLARLIDQIVAEYEAKGTLHRGEGPYIPSLPVKTTLRFPGKALALPDSVLVSDSARHSLVELALDGETVLRRIGSGTRGRADGGPLTASFSEPQGMCLLPAKIAEQIGYDVVAADTVNHLLRGVNLARGEVTTVAGSGRQWRSSVDFHPHDALSVDLSSPWDVTWYQGKVIIAMAGIHQLWWFDPIRRTAGVFAGTTVEALRDGDLEAAWLSQPSGLSVSADGERLWFVDSETSALRYVEDEQVHTAIGQGLFDFGHVDGPAETALMQHPLGVCAMPDGSVLIADTYNGAIRRYADGQLSTVATDLAEPSDIAILADGAVVVVESAAHQIVRLAPGAVLVDGGRLTVKRPATAIRPGEVTLEILFTPPPGQKLDESFGPSTRLEVSASPPELLLEGAGVTTSLVRRLVVNPAVESGVLQVVAQAATCDKDVEHAACHLTRQDWGVPVTVDGAAPDRLPLALLAR
jgi:thiol-disulfide isomerase/thioredoxin/sugar lactone lactonase YvrE